MTACVLVLVQRNQFRLSVNNMASGSSEKRFACGKCSRHFNLAETLFGHYRSHMQEEYACSSCFDEFATTQLFLIHRDADSPDCHAAKAISKTSVNRKRKQKDMENKLKGLAREFQLQIESRDVWVCWWSPRTQCPIENDFFFHFSSILLL